MRVGIDARFITNQPRRGIGNYSLNLVVELVQLEPGIEFVLYISSPDIEGILPYFPNVKIKQLWPSYYPIWENIALPIAAMRDRLDVLHCLGNTAPLYLPHGVQLIISLMDVMFLQSGIFVPKPTTMYQKLGRLYRRSLVPLAVRSAKKIITISEFSRLDILKLIPSIKSSIVHVTHLSYDAAFLIKLARSDGSVKPSDVVVYGNYILCLGAEDPRKNTLRLVQVYLQLFKEKSIVENLVICGYSNWERSQTYRAVKDAGAEERVTFLDFVTIDELAKLYRGATLFVYPSLYEGFGIPILEAFASGCPVAASNTTSIPEVAGSAALYFDPLNSNELAQTLLKALNDESLRSQLIENGFKRAKQFSWTLTASKTSAVYRDVVAR